MCFRIIEELAKQRNAELKVMHAPVKVTARARQPRHAVRRHTGWVLIAIGLRLAESGSR